MSFVEQEDIFEVVEKIMINLFKKFSNKKLQHEKFPKISYEDAMLKFGTDKPDLRNPLIINDLTSVFTRNDIKFDIFKKLVKSGSKVRSILTKNTQEKTRSVFDNIDKWAKEQGAAGIADVILEKRDKIYAKGEIGKLICEDTLKVRKKEISEEIRDGVG